MPKSKEYLSSDSESGSDVEEPQPKPKKAKIEKKPAKKEEKKKGGASKSGPGGEVSFELSRNRFVSIQEFRGKKLVSIREYFEKDGEQLPGRKGIALTVEQWKKLKACMNEIDDELES